ncbi:MAG: hypothetical protein HZC37_07310 [Burkholderiales bacterium]|nr:hypothetical protein [Burkholderiales bacterium]
MPPLLRARILAEARRGTEMARAQRPWWRRIDAAWTPWRMGGAGTAAAAVLAATVLWVGRDEQPAAPDLRPAPQSPAERRSASPGVTAPATAPRPAPAPAAPALSSPAAPQASEAAAPGAATALTAPGTPPAPTPSRDAPRADRRGADVREAARRSQPPPPPAPPSPRVAEAARMADAAPQAAAEREAQSANDARVRDEGAATERARQVARHAEMARGSAPASPSPPAAAPSPAPPRERPTPFVDATPAAPPATAAPASPPPPPAATEAAAPTRRDRQEVDASGSRFHRERAAVPASAPVAAAPPSITAAPAAPASPPTVQAPSAVGVTAAAPASPAGPARPSRGFEVGGRELRSVSRTAMVEAWSTLPDPAAWRRRAPGIVEAPLARGWLTEFAAATRGRWTAVEARTATSGETWTLVHAGGRQARLIWLPGAVIACEPQTERCEQARLDEAMLAALRQGLRR